MTGGIDVSNRYPDALAHLRPGANSRTHPVLQPSSYIIAKICYSRKG